MLYNGVIEKGEWAVAESCKHALKLDQIKNLGKPAPLPAVWPASTGKYDTGRTDTRIQDRN